MDEPELDRDNISRQEYEFINRRDPTGSYSSIRVTASEMSRTAASTSTASFDSHTLHLNDRIIQINAKVDECDKKIEELRRRRAALLSKREALLAELRLCQDALSIKGKAKATHVPIDYFSDGFDWSSELRTTMKRVFDINDFRLCQKGVCNANMDGRDIVCVMPTGGGKSLTYQLPALLTPGCTLVISPLISLITDQILHLKEAGVEAVMLTGGTSHEAVRDAMTRLRHSIRPGAQSSHNAHISSKEIKLCYVTPEKIAKSPSFSSLLEELAAADRLARIVIDEAHCVSQLGHDFRPDYVKLSKLRKLFPHVPIMALSATCPPQVLSDLISILKLKEITEGTSSGTEGTVYFSAPLYRKNLHYSVLPKPSAMIKTIQTMVKYIMQHHPDETGIVYCLTKKDAENVAAGLNKESGGKIKTGVYHADVGDGNKEDLHTKWRNGTIKVVCATIAFGLGIDKADVRFVLHHSLSKSIDGFYQESGRAGRDGKDADCILYYRPQDASRISAMICGEKKGQQSLQKLIGMLVFAQNLKECRKVLFARYFTSTSWPSVPLLTSNGADSMEPCGHCDNCIRQPGAVEDLNVTLEAWRAIKVAEAMALLDKGRVTLSRLVDLARGKRGTASMNNRKKQKGKENHEVDVEDLTDGRIDLSREDTETLLVDLLISQYLVEVFHQNPYSMNVYVLPGPAAPQLSRFSLEELENGNGPEIRCSFRRTPKERKHQRQRKQLGNRNEQCPHSSGRPNNALPAVEEPGLVEEIDAEDEAMDGDNENGDDSGPEYISSDAEVDVVLLDPPMMSFTHLKRKYTTPFEGFESDQDDDIDNNDWMYSMRTAQPRHKRLRNSDETQRIVVEGDRELIVLSSD